MESTLLENANINTQVDAIITEDQTLPLLLMSNDTLHQQILAILRIILWGQYTQTTFVLILNQSEIDLYHLASYEGVRMLDNSGV